MLVVYAQGHGPDTAYQTDVLAKLAAFGVFGAVDGVDAGLSTPTLAELQQYDAVLVMPEYLFADPVALGDNLADYADAGGGVVLSMFAMIDDPGPCPLGRFKTDDYYLIPPQVEAANNQVTGYPREFSYGFTPIVPSHPILTGVSTFFGGGASMRPATNEVRAGATVVATWDDPIGAPLVVVGTVGATRRADLGFYPPTNDLTCYMCDQMFVDASDATLIVANALRWVAHDL